MPAAAMCSQPSRWDSKHANPVMTSPNMRSVVGAGGLISVVGAGSDAVTGAKNLLVLLTFKKTVPCIHR